MITEYKSARSIHSYLFFVLYMTITLKIKNTLIKCGIEANSQKKS